MEERILQTARDIHGLYPHTHIWGFPISGYLFLGGLASGILLFASIYYLKGKSEEMQFTVKIAPIFTFVFVILIGLLLLVYDLHHKLYVMQLFMAFRIESPMSWGAWILTIVSVFSLLWPLSFIDESMVYLEKRGWRRVHDAGMFINKYIIHKFSIVKLILDYFTKYRRFFAYIILILSLILGMYTGILLSAFNAHPLWNTSILGPLFLTSGISTGAAFIMWLSKNKKERLYMSGVDMVLIGIEIFLIVHLLMGIEAGPKALKDAAYIFLGGEYTVVFWAIFVVFGLLLPFLLEAMELKGKHIPPSLPAILVLMGGLVFRIIIVAAGQMSEYPL